MDIDNIVGAPQVRDYLTEWRTLCAAVPGILPGRRMLDPLRIPGLLSNVWIYRRLPDGGFVSQIVGESITTAWQVPTRHRRLEDIVPKGEDGVVAGRFNKALDERLLIHSLNQSAGRKHMYAERIYAPMLDDDGFPNFLFGLSVYQSDPQMLRTTAVRSLRHNIFRAFDAVTLAYLGRITDTFALENGPIISSQGGYE